MEKVETTTTYWVCSICRTYHQTEKGALECEAIPFSKVKIRDSVSHKLIDNWKKGMVIIVHLHDIGDRLAVIVDEKKKEGTHNIFPTLGFLDRDDEQYSWWEHEDIKIVDRRTIRKKIKRWLDVLGSKD